MSRRSAQTKEAVCRRILYTVWRSPLVESCPVQLGEGEQNSSWQLPRRKGRVKGAARACVHGGRPNFVQLLPLSWAWSQLIGVRVSVSEINGARRESQGRCCRVWQADCMYQARIPGQFPLKHWDGGLQIPTRQKRMRVICIGSMCLNHDHRDLCAWSCTQRGRLPAHKDPTRPRRIPTLIAAMLQCWQLDINPQPELQHFPP